MNTNARVATILALLIAATGMNLLLRAGSATPLRKPLAGFPGEVAGWKSSAPMAFPEGVLKVLQLTDYVNRNYVKDGVQVNLYVGFYAHQRAGESMHSPKNCLPGSGWEVLDNRRVQIEIPKLGRSIDVNHYVVQNNEQKQFVLYWYDTHGKAFASEYQGKVLLVTEALRSGRSDGALIRVMLPFTGPNSTAVEKIAHQFAQEVYPVLRDFLPAE